MYKLLHQLIEGKSHDSKKRYKYNWLCIMADTVLGGAFVEPRWFRK